MQKILMKLDLQQQQQQNIHRKCQTLPIFKMNTERIRSSMRGLGWIFFAQKNLENRFSTQILAVVIFAKTVGLAFI